LIEKYGLSIAREVSDESKYDVKNMALIDWQLTESDRYLQKVDESKVSKYKVDSNQGTPGQRK